MISRIEKDDRFGLTIEEIEECVNPSDFIGLCPLQVEEFCENVVAPILADNVDSLHIESELHV